MPSTSEHYSPWDLLPAPVPRTVDPPLDYFYSHVAKHLVKDTVRIMQNGLHIDLDRVEELEQVLDKQLSKVKLELASNPIIQQYLEIRFSRQLELYREDRKSKMRSPSYYLKPFNHKLMAHRSYFMHLFALENNIPLPADTLEGTTNISKWPAKQVKRFASTRPILQRLLSGDLVSHPLIYKAMQSLAEDKATIYNEKYTLQIKNPDIPYPEFNADSPDQKHEVFTGMLGLESDKLTDAWTKYERTLEKAHRYGHPEPDPPKNKYSWNRDNVEMVMKTTDNPDIKSLCQSLIDHSFAAIVRNNFIESFYTYSVPDNNGNWRLHGQYVLLGAKSGRFTSKNPNMLNAPSSKSIFAKPIKKCFTAPEGFLIATADYAALEDKVIANLTGDKNKIITQTDAELDGHLFHATIYFRQKFIDMLGDMPHRELAIAAKQALDGEDKELSAAVKKLRDTSKNITLTSSICLQASSYGNICRITI